MKTLIICHGALGAKADLEKLAIAFINQNYKVFTFSFSGHGASDFKTDFGIGQFSIELEEFISQHQLTKPSVIGYSMGGYVALYLASRSNHLLHKIITLGTKFNWTNEVVEEGTRNLVPEIIVEKMPAFATELQTKHSENWKELVVRTAEMLRAIGKNNYLSTETLKSIKTPTLLGLGDKDYMVTLEETLTTYKILPSANMFVLPNSKHALENLNVPTFIAITKEFLTE